jgi:CRP/FNR family transcriptional regulator
MLPLGRKTARERVALFLRTEAMRLPACQRSLRMLQSMTRGDIGDYLGLTIETVSRTMTALRKSGVIDVSHRF